MMVGPSSGRLTPSSGISHSRAGSASRVMTRTTDNPTSVKVVVRIRPPTTEHVRISTRFQRTVVAALNATTLQLESATSGGSASNALTKTPKSTFTFDRVISPEEGQSEVFACAEPLVESFLTGLNATILAYGQTSSGKSYTMGTTAAPTSDVESEDRLGITPRAVALIFDRMREITNASKGATTFDAKLSYVEIYNEDLIDLLAGNADVRPTVQIREDKQGNIFWSGLREVKVTSALEVMTYVSRNESVDHLTEGSALRQTGATDMNAQSSRSHAIFSLTLTQQKSTDGGPVDGPSSSVSRASARASYSPRVSSPGPGATSRSATPSHDRPGSRFGLRPPSFIGPVRAAGDPLSDSSPGLSTSTISQCTTITSKFHFVDLAGSERLKRTAAAGGRVKEGISINAGLLALGNVISALGDPSKKSTHVPYRDSKLTRLLQDSLGGNAHTMMIACVSPTELNLNESLSTVKYANRARNIKNRAEVHEIEAGWEDIEYLQRTLIKLRAELALLKSGTLPSIVDADGRTPPISDGRTSPASPSPDVQELHNKFTDLSHRYAQLLSEQVQFPRVSSENGVPPQSMQDEFCRVVDPIIEEYERSISAIESQLALTRAALSHSEDELRELEIRVEAEVATNQSNAKNMEELKARIARFCEREATTEAYVRDLESKLKDFGDQDASRGSAVTDLRKEITRHREHGVTQELYIKDLEVRLAKAEETGALMRNRIDVLERDIGRHEEAYRELETRLSLLNTADDQKILLAELDTKNLRLIELERSVDDLKRQNSAAETEVERLVRLAATETESRAELQSRVRSLERAATLSTTARDSVVRDSLPEETGLDSIYGSALVNRGSAVNGSADSTRGVLVPLSQNGDELVSRGTGSGVLGDGCEETPLSPTSPSRSASSSPNKNRGPRARRSMPLSPQHRLSFLGRGQGPHLPIATHSRSASFSCPEQSSPIPSQASLPPKARSPSPSDGRSPSAASRDNPFGVPFSPTHGTQSAFTNERTYEQMETEIRRLQQALTERERETIAQEVPLLRSRGDCSESSNSDDTPRFGVVVSNSRHSVTGCSTSPSEEPPASDNKLVGDADTAAERLDHLMRSMAQKESLHRAVVDQLQDSLTSLQRRFDELSVLSRDQVTNMSREIGRLRAQIVGSNATFASESLDRSDQGGLTDDPIEGRGICDDHVFSGTRHVSDQSESIEVGPSRDLDDFGEAHNFRDEEDDETDHVEADCASSENTLAFELAEATNRELSTLAEAGQTRILSTMHPHTVLDQYPSAPPQSEHLVQSATTSTEPETTASQDDLEALHALELKQREAAHSDELARLEATHQSALDERDRAHADVVAKLELQRAQDLEMAATLHSSATSVLEKVNEAQSSRTEESHAAAVRALAESQEAVLDASREAASVRLTQLSAQHEAALLSKHNAHHAAIRMAEAEQTRLINDLNKSHIQELHALSDTLLSSHQEELRRIDAAHLESVALLEKQHRDNTTALQTTHEQAVYSMRIEHEQALDLLRTESEKEIASLRAAHENESASMRDTFEDELASLRSVHEVAVSSIRADHAKHTAVLQAAHDREMALSRAMHEQELAQKSSEAAAICEKIRTTSLAKIDLATKERDETQSKYVELDKSYALLEGNLADAQKSLTRMQTDHSCSTSALNQELVDARLLADRLAAEADALRQERVLEHSQSKGPATSSVDAQGAADQGNSTGLTQDLTMPPRSLPTSSQAPNRSGSISSASHSAISPRESVASGTASPPPTKTIDSSLVVQRVDELEAQVSKLVKQLTHCEGDLQANIDLVNTLESALSDSERNLRKARVQMNDLAKERDNYLSQNEAIRRELQDSHNETENVRNSIMEVESQLQAERYNRERAKQELERRLEDVNRKGKNKFACF
ncbi:BZ3500_MvSof-1268-A1-R1_Chr4-2g07210 [Microbotryum saponariae]|uniref:BZ3500_MvSof-1268-A1-R1_Chr4-2g07210 protein n=1 Tax=Microbotryum saponariae TaxID=289078 RepID=A0A2X0MCB9_9BASI|nr:BZ3500_MvSof-1268-A1-R1_Chr4-2g07210 [Microbotryum saponariae]SDA06875.1 BZ3501_MvSof-1269-A2-R1_Chr4-2g06921 [Microbotryum saponariae]